MRVLLVGVGTVGEAIARLSAGRPWLECMVLADHDLDRARRIAQEIGDDSSHPTALIDASDERAVEELARAHDVDLVVNAVDPRFVMPVFNGALAADADYMDLAVSTSEPHPTDPYGTVGRIIGDEQFAMDDLWRERGRLALVGQGISPGLAQVFAAHAAKHLFDEIHDINIRAGGDLRVEGYPIATVFNIWTTIEECLNPSLVWEKERGYFTLPPFSEPERFIFPEGIGPVECVHVEHEDVAMIPRVLDARRVTFKYALGEQFIGALDVAACARARPHRPDHGGRPAGDPAQRRRHARSRPVDARRQHGGTGDRRHPRDRVEGRGAAGDLQLPDVRRRGHHGSLRAAAGRVADGIQRGRRHGTARRRCVAGQRRARG